MTEIIKKPDYKGLLDRVSTLIEEARRKTVKQVNTIIIQTYWEIGRLIVDEEQKEKERAEYGERVLKRLTNDLTKKYGRGFSERNLEMMRKFYITLPSHFADNVCEILTTTDWRNADIICRIPYTFRANTLVVPLL